MTATAARQLGRPLAALPWDSRDPLGAAPHALIRAGAATLVRDATDVMELLGAKRAGGAPNARRSTERSTPKTARATPAEGAVPGDREEVLWGALRDRPEPLENAARRAQLTIAEASAAFVLLELLGRARRVPGGAVRRWSRP